MDSMFCNVVRQIRNIYITGIIKSIILASLINKIKKRWNKYYSSNIKTPASPSEVLFFNQHLLPKKGVALDLACGYGANSICLANNKLNVTAWDISQSALGELSLRSKDLGLIINCENRDVLKYPPKPNTFDVIVVTKFLDRQLIKHIRNAINDNGLIFYQTFIKNRVGKFGPTNPDYQLERNELLEFFNDWKLILYREEGKIGNLKSGFRNQAMIIAQKL